MTDEPQQKPEQKQQHKETPAPVKLALQAVAILERDDPALVEEAKKKLPGFALRLAAAGRRVTVNGLVASARAGEIDKVITARQQVKTYDQVVQQLRAVVIKEKPLWAVALDLNDALEAGNLPVVRSIADKILTRLLSQNDYIPIAAANGHLHIIKYFVEERGLDIHAGSRYRGEIAQFAAEYGHLDILKYIAEKNPAIMSDTAMLTVLLNTAAFRGNLDMVKYLVEEQGADVFAVVDGARGNTFAHAAMGGHVHLVRYLAEKHNLKADAWMKLLYTAAANGHLDTVEYLVEFVGVEQGASYHKQALAYAAAYGHLPVIKYLIEDLHVSPRQDGAGEFALLSAMNSQRPDIAEYLINETGADVTELSAEQLDLLTVYYKAKLNWLTIAHTQPPLVLYGEDPHFYKPVLIKKIRDILERETKHVENYEQQMDLMSFHAAGLFGTEARVMQYLEKWGRGKSSMPLHDLISRIALPQRKTPEMNMKAWGDAALKCGPTMARLVNWADILPVPEKSDDGRTWSMVNTREKLVPVAYPNSAKNLELSRLCLEHFVDELSFEKARLVAEHPSKVKNIPDITIPGEQFDIPGATFRRLAANDVRGLFLGQLVDNCQSIGSAGEHCAQLGFMSEHGGFYVVEKDDKVIGETWAWRGEAGEIVFDSLEPLGTRVSPMQWLRLTREFAKALEKEPGDITAFHVGKEGRTPKELRAFFQQATAPAWPTGIKGEFHRDSGEQLVVWRSEKYRAPLVQNKKITPVGG